MALHDDFADTGGGNSAFGRTFIYEGQQVTVRRARRPDGGMGLGLFVGPRMLFSFAGSIVLQNEIGGFTTIGSGGQIVNEENPTFNMLTSGAGGGGGGGGGGFAPQPFLSTEAGFEAQIAADIAAQEAAQAFASQQSAEQQEFANQQRIEAERAAKSLQLIQGANALAQARGQQIQQARQLLATTLGQDVIQGSALLSGGLGFGTTPNESFRGQLQGFTNEPTVAFNANAPLGVQQGQFEELATQVAGGAPNQPTVGFAHGGTIPLDKEATILVGEAGPEILDISKGSLRVRPLTANAVHGQNFTFDNNPNRGAFGGDFGAGFRPSERERTLQPIGGSRFGPGATRESIAGVAAPIFEHLGFNTVPFAARRRGVIRPLSLRDAGGQLSEQGLSFAGLNALGINPRLFRFGTSVFFRDREGNLQRFRDMDQFDELQFRRSDIVQVAPTGSELAALRAEAENAPLVSGRGITSEASTGFSATSGQAIVSPTTGLLLPNPAQIASLFRPGVLDPLTKSTLVSLYQDANISPEGLEGAVSAFTPSGSAQLGVQAGFG